MSNKTQLPARTVAATLIATLLASACVTNPDGTQRLDDRATGALIGAAAGCLIAGAGKNCAKGALAGAAVGFLIGWYFESKKIASAQQINAEYAKAGKSVPKKEVLPAAFTPSVQSGTPNASGEREIAVTATTDLTGYGDKVPVVEQRYAIYDENNKLVEEKKERVAAVDGAGRYQTQSKFKLPADAKGKNYTVQTSLVSNDKVYKANSYKVTFNEWSGFTVALLTQ